MTTEERRAFALGRRSFENGDWDGALAHLEPLVRTRPGFADVHYLIGLAHEHRGDLDPAARSLEQALRINPRYAEARLALVAVHEQQGDFDRAEAVAEPPPGRNGADGPLDPVTRGKLANLQASLGDAYREAKELGEAIEAYRKALEDRKSVV